MKLVSSLMMCENMGDVHDEILYLCALLEIDPPEGDFIDGWEEGEYERFAG